MGKKNQQNGHQKKEEERKKDQEGDGEMTSKKSVDENCARQDGMEESVEGTCLQWHEQLMMMMYASHL